MPSVAADTLLMPLGELLARMGVSPQVDDATKSKYLGWLQGVSRAIRDYVKWDLTYHSQDTLYYSGNGQQNLVLKTPWLWANSDLKVYLDMTGYGGFGPNAFAANTLLTTGTDYIPRCEGHQVWLPSTDVQVSKSGLLIKLQNVNNSLWWPSDLFYRPSQPGGLAWMRQAYWAPGQQNIKVVADWGFIRLPEDLNQAVVTFVTLIRAMAANGFPVTSESLGDYSYSGFLGQWQELGTVRQSLSVYRDVQI